MKILAVEDDRVARAVLLKALRRLGHDVVEADDGDVAWEMLKTEPVRVVVSDWTMPKTDGLDLCRRIRQRAGAVYIYFILLTGRDEIILLHWMNTVFGALACALSAYLALRTNLGSTPRWEMVRAKSLQ